MFSPDDNALDAAIHRCHGSGTDDAPRCFLLAVFVVVEEEEEDNFLLNSFISSIARLSFAFCVNLDDALSRKDCRNVSKAEVSKDDADLVFCVVVG